jgi:hypothetical protein
MRHVDVKDKVAELGVNHPEWSVFRRLGDLTKLRATGAGFQAVNYESGVLLYALVRKHRPRRIVEVGTGRGYGALCMAMALEDAGIDGQVVTIDARSSDEPQEWAIDDGAGPRVARLSRREVWDRHVESRLCARVRQVHGSSFDALAGVLAEGGPSTDLVYIDGDHTHPVVRHDFYACLLLARPPFRMLLDDYTPLSHLYGVRRLVDDEIAPVFEVEAIHTDGRWHGQAAAAVPLDRSNQAQVLLDSEQTTRPLEEAFPRAKLARIVSVHRRWPRALSKVDQARAVLTSGLARRRGR